MNKFKRSTIFLFMIIALFLLTLYARDASDGIAEGIGLCIKSVIPSLFPFIFLATQMRQHISGKDSPLFTPIKRLCRLPDNSQALWLLGQLSGYPVGAQMIGDAYRNGNLNMKTARRMLGFCCNAGPSFIFGVLGSLFSSVTTVWWLWAVHIISALIVGIVIPSDGGLCIPSGKHAGDSLPQSLDKSIKTMATICGWVIIFRAAIKMLEKHFLFGLPFSLRLILSGILELTNGCYMLYCLSSESARFVLASTFLGFGGLCVLLQTLHVTASLGTGFYIPGKLLQALVSFFLSLAIQPALFGADYCLRPPILTLLLAAVLTMALVIFLRFPKKCSIFEKNVV